MFGDLVRGHRRRRALSQEELASRAGISPRALREIESGRVRQPHAATVRRLAEALALAEAEREQFHCAPYAMVPEPSVERPDVTGHRA